MDPDPQMPAEKSFSITESSVPAEMKLPRQD
jgi:hypothetical protein